MTSPEEKLLRGMGKNTSNFMVWALPLLCKNTKVCTSFYLFTFLISCLFIFWTITICFPFYLGGVAEYRASEGKTVEVPYRGIFSVVCSNTYKNCNDCNKNSIIAIKMRIVLINCIFFRWCSWYYAWHFGRFAISLYLCWCRTCQRNAQKNYFYPCDSTIEQYLQLDKF